METKKTAAQWLDVAIRYENEGTGSEKKAEMALNAAVRADDTEHKADPEAASLPRA